MDKHQSFIDAFLRRYEEVSKSDTYDEDQYGMDSVCSMLIEVHGKDSYRYDDLCRALRGIFLPRVEIT